MERFQDDRYYRTNDPALAVIGTRGSLAVLRHQNRGPRFVKLGNRVLYRGYDLNEFLDNHVIETKND